MPRRILLAFYESLDKHGMMLESIKMMSIKDPGLIEKYFELYIGEHYKKLMIKKKEEEEMAEMLKNSKPIEIKDLLTPEQLQKLTKPEERNYKLASDIVVEVLKNNQKGGEK